MSPGPKSTKVFCFFFSKKKTSLTFAFCFGLTACHSIDPLYRAGLFHPLGSNAANLQAEVADPADLQHGKSVAGAYTPEAVIAVNRLRTHSVLPLPSSYFAKVEVSGGDSTDSSVASAPNGSP